MGGSPTVAVVGLGRLGAPIAACLASRGFAVIGADLDARKVEDLKARVCPVFEPGLADLLQRTGDLLSATTDIEEAAAAADVTFVIVPTPTGEDGTFSLRHVRDACRRIGEGLRTTDRYHLVVLTSTVMPGATGGPVRLALEEASGRRVGEDLGLCYSPEFVALGTVIRDFLEPDFVLVGESDGRAGDLLESVYLKACTNHPAVARMSFINAELAKLAVNTYVTTKISFANLLARICERLPGGDVDAVTGALGLDSRIGPKYLRGRISYGGPCFPRDNRALAALAERLDLPADLPDATDRFNRWQLEWLADTMTALAPPGATVGILGLSYKAGSDVAEESPGLWLATELLGRGRRVIAYDPMAATAARAVLPLSVYVADSAQECVGGCEVAVLTTPWPEFTAVPAEVWSGNSEPRTVVDCWGTLRWLSGEPGVRYVALGQGRLLGDTATASLGWRQQGEGFC